MGEHADAAVALPESSDERLRLGVLISGSGTNLQELIDASAAGALDARVVVVISNKPDAYGLERARKVGVPAVFIDRTQHTSIASYNAAITDALALHDVELVVMAGYMRLLGQQVLEAYPERVINLHPALLPSFPGASAIRDAFDYGVKVTGVTVHLADEHFDRGPVVAQRAVPVEEDDTVESLEARIHEAEHALIVESVRLFTEGRVEVSGRKVHVLPAR